jgi:lipoprotein-releasing system permease protein
MKLLFQIAKALLLARLKQTLVAAVGVTFSITMFITLLSFMTGLNSMLDGLILNRSPHIRIYKDIKPEVNQPVMRHPEYKGSYPIIHSIKAGNSRKEIYNSKAIIETLKKDSRVMGIAPRVLSQVFFNQGNIELNGVVNGIDAVEEARLFHFNDYVISGQSQMLSRVSNSIILGKGLAEKLLVQQGDVVNITTPQGQQFRLKVVGIFQSGLNDFDKVQSYASIRTVQTILGKTESYYTDLNLKIYDIQSAPALAKEYAHVFNVDAEDIQTANAQFETGSFVRSLISYVVGITLLIVAGFGIYNILNMMIYEKMDSIAILKATGFSGQDVNTIFIMIALVIGLFGGISGLVFGYGLSVVVDHIPFKTAALPTITTYPVNYNPAYYFIAITFSIVTTYLAGYFPARKASKVDPVIIIRGK